ncbi:MAG: dihydroneopterin triphosphate 2'-epimerase [Hahellaceae bacterium]|jgi:D-erythro-7,8-dihydroneopterin triphosphate epimerase|nr:dihydroneopterin triphosphate 2'-epimerase [Hahellaceae bacterium]MCP5209881.1 dihydroneopterin triphosphate 2'-epimerase [Hahellaceae bacterium]
MLTSLTDNTDKPHVALIRIKNLRLRTYIGIKDEEINNQQDVIINAHIYYDAANAVNDNCIESALNYRTITKTIISFVEQEKFLLLERMTQDILDIIMANKQVLIAEVEIDKPHALRFCDSVSVTLRARRH